MKFTKLTGVALTGATLLSILAPATSTFAATTEGKTEDNGGTPLPQTDKTVAGISFGDNKPNANTGFLRLQMVPHVLDFGNHVKFDSAYTTFTADGKNYANGTNDRQPSYKEDGVTNQTAILNTDDTKLKELSGDAWATVVDKQVTREQLDTYATTTNQAAGTWDLNVKADGALMAKNGKTLADAQLLFKNTAYAKTDAVYDLTNEDQDSTFTADLASSTATDKGVADVGTITKSFALDLSDKDAQHKVAHADANQGTGANVFGWKPTDIQLVLPATSSVQNAEYTANLTWTLSTGVTGSDAGAKA
ncbi:WxL domain-containing protein [Latilactobacillus graminis]|uniref:WxL domain-containing protein n=2 Tax=Latilactobacillus graminis TaxID=60519 RepID=A0AA89L5F5_9LACO|nr:WxL domain-containing protein [Latilactobacillus graminis]KRM24470.1 hypothetical protein FC90_GL000174 [Latilactobacillus graminis DSM 20719]QFP79072.1 cell surface protein [Latilactobacillus graminis]